VQSTGCAPIVAAFEQGARVSETWPNARTVAFGINVPKAFGDFLVLDALYATAGTAVAVTDDEVVLLNTGSGLLYPDAVRVDAPTVPARGAVDLPE